MPFLKPFLILMAITKSFAMWIPISGGRLSEQEAGKGSQAGCKPQHGTKQVLPSPLQLDVEMCEKYCSNKGCNLPQQITLQE